MLVLLATKKGQGLRDSDFNFTDEGELVYIAAPCGRDQGSVDVDGGCGCGRCFTGVESTKGSTTVVVSSIDMSLAEWTRRMYKGLVSAFPSCDGAAFDDRLIHTLAVAAQYPSGTILERRGDDVIQPRQVSA